MFGKKFLIQINSILSQKENGYLELLDSRVKAASNYFTPLFKKISTTIISHIELLKSESQIKTYLKELLELETMCYEQVKRMQKAVVLTDVMLSKKEFTKQSISSIINDQSRIDRINTVLTAKASKSVNSTTAQKPKRVRGERKKKEKIISDAGEIIDTKTMSFQLFQQGKSIDEISKLRSLAITTIEGHLAQYVTKGELNAIQFVKKEKIKNIITAAKSIDSFKLGAIKAILGDEYSYADIRFAVADYFSKETEKTEA